MRIIQRLTIILELVVLFGPVTLLLFMAPIGVVGAAAQANAIVFFAMAAIMLLGGFSLYVCMHLAAHALDHNHRAPARGVVALAWASGVTAYLLVGLYVRLEPVILLIMSLPVVGGAHLTWLSWGSLSRARKA